MLSLSFGIVVVVASVLLLVVVLSVVEVSDDALDTVLLLSVDVGPNSLVVAGVPLGTMVIETLPLLDRFCLLFFLWMGYMA